MTHSAGTHLLVLAAGDLLQEGGWVLAVGQLEALLVEEGHHFPSGTVEDDVACMPISAN